MTTRLENVLADILQRHPKILVSQLAGLLEEEIEMRVQDRVRDLREQLEAVRDELTLDRIEERLLQNRQQDDDNGLAATATVQPLPISVGRRRP